MAAARRPGRPRGSRLGADVSQGMATWVSWVRLSWHGFLSSNESPAENTLVFTSLMETCCLERPALGVRDCKRWSYQSLELPPLGRPSNSGQHCFHHWKLQPVGKVLFALVVEVSEISQFHGANSKNCPGHSPLTLSC